MGRSGPFAIKARERIRLTDGWNDMASSTIEQKALRALAAFEKAGKSVSRVTLEGRKIEIVFSTEKEPDEFERIEMTYGKA